MTKIDNILYVDIRESKQTKVMASILYDNTKIEKLEVGDFLLRDVVFEHKTGSDFVASIFDQRLFTQIYNMKKYYNNVFLLISDNYINVNMLYNTRAKHDNFKGIIGSCCARGCPPIFAGNIDNMLELLEPISLKCTDGKNRSKPIMKKTSIKDVQKAIVCSFPGISETRARALLTHFGSINNILTASEKELCNVKDIGPKTAGKLRRILQKPYIG